MKRLFVGMLAAAAIASPALAADSNNNFKAGDMMVRMRGVLVAPDVGSSVSPVGGRVHVNNSVVPELDGTYFFTPNVSAELIAAVTRHNVNATAAGGINAGSAWLLPPTLTLQYHFNQLQQVKPYIGAGVNYTHFFNEDGGALKDVKYEDSFGGALQAGVDVPLGNNTYANFDVKKVFISTTAKFSPSGVKANVDLDPWLIGVGVGYKF